MFLVSIVLRNACSFFFSFLKYHYKTPHPSKKKSYCNSSASHPSLHSHSLSSGNLKRHTPDSHHTQPCRGWFPGTAQPDPAHLSFFLGSDLATRVVEPGGLSNRCVKTVTWVLEMEIADVWRRAVQDLLHGNTERHVFPRVRINHCTVGTTARTPESTILNHNLKMPWKKTLLLLKPRNEPSSENWMKYLKYRCSLSLWWWDSKALENNNHHKVNEWMLSCFAAITRGTSVDINQWSFS